MPRKITNPRNNTKPLKFRRTINEDYKKILLNYAINIIDHVELNQYAPLRFFFELLDHNNRISCVKEIYSYRGTLNKTGNYDDIIKNIHISRIIGDTILNDFNNKVLQCKDDHVFAIIKKYLKKEQSTCPKTSDDFLQRLKHLQETFILSDNDINFLTFAYIVFDTRFDGFDDIFHIMNFNTFRKLAARMTNLGKMIDTCLSEEGRLYSSYIIDSITRGDNFVNIDNSVCEYLSGVSEISLVEKYIKRDTSDSYPLKDSHIAQDCIGLITSLIKSKRPCNVLLHGMTGAGKTEFARSVVKSTGRTCYFLQYGEEKRMRQRTEEKSNYNKRKLALNVAINTVENNGGVLIVDEADFLLNTESMFFNVENTLEKGWLNNLLENTRASIIWISNNISMMYPSTLKRFSFRLYFDKLNDEQRLKIWKNQIKRSNLRTLIPLKLITTLAREYKVDAWAVASVMNILEIMNESRRMQTQDIEKLLRDVLSLNENKY